MPLCLIRTYLDWEKQLMMATLVASLGLSTFLREKLVEHLKSEEAKT